MFSAKFVIPYYFETNVECKIPIPIPPNSMYEKQCVKNGPVALPCSLASM